MLSRRGFLVHTSLALAAAALIDSLEASNRVQPKETVDWPDVREAFNLDPKYIHLGLFLLASHSRPVREAVERYRRLLDENPVITVEHSMFEPEFGRVPRLVKTAIANYIGGSAGDIALTRSTTESLALVYQGLPLNPGMRSSPPTMTTIHTTNRSAWLSSAPAPPCERSRCLIRPPPRARTRSRIGSDRRCVRAPGRWGSPGSIRAAV